MAHWDSFELVCRSLLNLVGELFIAKIDFCWYKNGTLIVNATSDEGGTPLRAPRLGGFRDRNARNLTTGKGKGKMKENQKEKNS